MNVSKRGCPLSKAEIEHRRNWLRGYGRACTKTRREMHCRWLRASLGKGMALQFAEKLRFLNEWEGHEFTRAVKSLKVCLRFSARGVLSAPSISFSANCLAPEGTGLRTRPLAIERLRFCFRTAGCGFPRASGRRATGPLFRCCGPSGRCRQPCRDGRCGPHPVR